MRVYRLTLELRNGYITPWHSDTIFGHLCWAIRQTQGESGLHDFLNLYDNAKAPVVISNGFPGDLFPKPLIQFPRKTAATKCEMIAQVAEGKRLKEIKHVSLDELNSMINGSPPSLSVKGSPVMREHVYQSQIDRFSETTSNGGNLYVQEVEFLKQYISIYLKIEEGWESRIIELFEQLGEMGYGKRRSIGMGVFKIQDFDEFTGFKISPNPNGYVLLSNYVPAKDDPIDGVYKTFVKYGKLGGPMSASRNPFKKPLLMIAPGACFRTTSPVRDYYGRIVKGISPFDKRVVQYGLAFAIPARVA